MNLILPLRVLGFTFLCFSLFKAEGQEQGSIRSVVREKNKYMSIYLYELDKMPEVRRDTIADSLLIIGLKLKSLSLPIEKQEERVSYLYQSFNVLRAAADIYYMHKNDVKAEEVLEQAFEFRPNIDALPMAYIYNTFESDILHSYYEARLLQAEVKYGFSKWEACEKAAKDILYSQYRITTNLRYHAAYYLLKASEKLNNKVQMFEAALALLRYSNDVVTESSLQEDMSYREIANAKNVIRKLIEEDQERLITPALKLNAAQMAMAYKDYTDAFNYAQQLIENKEVRLEALQYMEEAVLALNDQKKAKTVIQVVELNYKLKDLDIEHLELIEKLYELTSDRKKAHKVRKILLKKKK